METDDLDDLIADSLSSVQTALDGDRKAASEPAATSAGEAVRELQQGPARSVQDGVASEVFFSNLVKSFQDENFQKSMQEALQISDEKELAIKADASGPSAVASASNSGDVEDFLQNFMKSFESAVGNDEGFAEKMSGMLTSMLPKDLIVEPLQQLSDALDTYLKDKDQSAGVSASDRSRYESQLKLYKEMVRVYKSCDADPVPSSVQQEVQKLLAELHTYGEPPAEVMKQIAPKEAAEGDESFEDFVKAMGLGDNLGAAEQDLLKKLTEDPEELTKVMKDMAGKLDGENPEEACKQQ